MTHDDADPFRAAPTVTVVQRVVPAGAAPPPTGPPAAGRYRPRRLHARGGVGELFLATDEELDRDVALKSMQEAHASDPAGQERFIREARITGRLQHPGIVPVYGLGRDARGRPCYAMRFVEGESLSESIRRHYARLPAPDGSPPLTFRQLLLRFVAACNAMAYAHSRGVIHRDLKPQNIMLGRYGETLVVDWGLAKSVDSDSDLPSTDPKPGSLPIHQGMADCETLPGTAAGTPPFMSPEQAAGQWDQVGPASDVFSLGATLFVLLTGKLPFPGDNVEQVLSSVLRGEFPRPRTVRPETPAALEAICLRAMAFRPEDRYPSALDLAAEVERWLADEPVRAHRAPWHSRLRRWGRRHPATVGATAAACLVVVAGLTAATFWLSAANQREQALREDAQNHEQVAAAERDEAARQRDQAAASFRIARDAVRQLLDDDGLASLRTLPQVEPVRLKLLERALGFHETFLKQAGNDPSVREDAAYAQFEVADINRELGRYPEAVASYEAVRGFFLLLLRDRPGETRYEYGLARLHNNLSLAYLYANRHADAEREVRVGIQLNEKLRQKNPGDRSLLVSLAKSYHNLGMAQRDLGRLPESEASYRRSLEFGAELLKAAPNEVYHRLDQAKHHCNLASLLLLAKRYDETGEHVTASLGILEPLARENDGITDVRRTLARALLVQGRWLTATNDSIGPAEAAFRKAMSLFERLAREFKHVADNQADLAEACACLSSLYVGAKRTADGIDDFRRELAARLAELALRPDDATLAISQAGKICNRGCDLMDAGSNEAAIEFLSEAIRLLTAVRAKSGNPVPSQLFLRNCLVNRGLALQSLGQLDEAIGDWRNAQPLADNAVDRADLELRIACAYRSLGRIDDAASSATTASKTDKLPATFGVRIAFLLSQCTAAIEKDETRPAADRERAARECSARALAILKVYQSDPHLRDPQTLKSLRENPAYDALRRLPEFDSLLATLRK